MIVDIFLLIYTIFLGLVALWAAYSSYLVIRCGVPPVPTPRRITKTMLGLAKLQSGQQVYDLGCGFGTVLFAAQKAAPKNIFYGYEINRPVLCWAQLRNRIFKHQVKFYAKDFFTQDLRRADIIFCYLWPSIMEQIETEVWPQLQPGTKLISHGFPLGKVAPEKVVKVGRSKVMLYEKA